MTALQRNGARRAPASVRTPPWPVPVRELRLDLGWGVRAALREDALFLGGVGAYWLIVLAAGARALAAPARALLIGSSIWAALAVLYLAASGFGRVTRTRAARRPVVWLRRRARDPFEALRIILGASGICAVLLSFGAFKPLISKLGSYRWDGLFSNWDRLLHGGSDPWVLTRALPGGAATSLVLDRAYLGWYPVMLVACLAALLGARPALRQQFLLSLLVIWAVAGTALAFAFASGGPVYYQALTGQPGTFSPVAAELSRLHLWAPVLQQKIWAAHLAGNAVPFSGISAMPSVHVAGATLVCLLALRLRPALGVAGLLFWALIMVGSVHLGWHYAVDGYAGTALALLSWAAAGVLAKAWLGRQHTVHFSGTVSWLRPRRTAAPFPGAAAGQRPTLPGPGPATPGRPAGAPAATRGARAAP